MTLSLTYNFVRYLYTYAYIYILYIEIQQFEDVNPISVSSVAGLWDNNGTWMELLRAFSGMNMSNYPRIMTEMNDIFIWFIWIYYEIWLVALCYINIKR